MPTKTLTPNAKSIVRAIAAIAAINVVAAVAVVVFDSCEKQDN